MMLFPCFTVFKFVHELTGDLQRKSAESSWGFTHFRVPTDRNDFYLNPESHPNAGLRTERGLRLGLYRFDRGRIRADCGLPL